MDRANTNIMNDLILTNKEYKHIGITGTRDILYVEDNRQIKLHHMLYSLKVLSEAEYLHHGDCLGVDAMSHDASKELGYKIVIHPPLTRAHQAFKFGCHELRQAQGYKKRNQAIIDASDILIALPKNKNDIDPRSGTSMTINMAKRKGIPIILL